MDKICSSCHERSARKNHRYCGDCHNEYMKKWRKNNPLTDAQRYKNDVRRRTNIAIKKGLLIPKDCQKCGAKKVEAHHDNYEKPYNVAWLCFTCHREHHKESYARIGIAICLATKGQEV